jgi:hypothetical protein
MSHRREMEAIIRKLVRENLGPDAEIGPINWGDGHRRMLLYNRRHERAYQRSRRNQPPRQKDPSCA